MKRFIISFFALFLIITSVFTVDVKAEDYEEDPSGSSETVNEVTEAVDNEEDDEEILVLEQDSINEEEDNDSLSFDDEDVLPVTAVVDETVNIENSSSAVTIYWGLKSNGNNTYELHLSSFSFAETMAYSGTTDGVFKSNSRPWISYNAAITKVSIDDAITPTQTANWFNGLQNVTSIEGLNNLYTYDVTDMSSMFYYCLSLTSLDLSGLDTSNVTDMSRMFYNCPSLETLDVSGFNTSNVTDMSWMFYNCSSLSSLDISDLDTSNVTDMSYMFYNCSSLTTLDVSDFDTSNVTNMNSMFRSCSKLEHIYAENDWDTNSVTDSSNMFTEDTKLHNYNSSYTDKTRAIIDNGMNGGYLESESGPSIHWGLQSNGDNTYELHLSSVPFTETMVYSSTTDGAFNSKTQPWKSYKTAITKVSIDNMIAPGQTAYWFYGLENATSIEGLNNLNTSYVTSMVNMFYGCSSLTSLDLSHFDTSGVTNMAGMFSSCKLLNSLNVSDFDTSNVTNMMSMFYWCTSLTSLDLSNFDTSNVTEMSYIFGSCQNLTSLNVSGFDTSSVTNMSGMFSCCKSLESLNVSGFDTSNVINMMSMFYWCTSLTSLDLSNFNTTNVKYMTWMFSECTSLRSLDMTDFDTSNVTDMAWIFGGCSSLASLDVSGFDTSNVTKMPGMFSTCSSLTSLDVSSFDTSNVTDMECMFGACSSLTSLDVSDFDTSNVTNMSGMFEGCSNLEHIYAGKGWKTNSLNSSLNMFTDDESLHNYSSSYTDKTKAVIDNGKNGGYLESKSNLSFYWGLESNGNGAYVLHLSSASFTETMTYSGATDGVFTFDSQPWNSYKKEITKVSIDSMIAPGQTTYWFYGLKNATSIEGLNNLNTSYVTDMTYMFGDCQKITSLDLSGFDTSNVTNMSDMFSSCQSLKSLDVSYFDTSNVTDMTSMFYWCVSLTSLDLSSFDTTKVTKMSWMFNKCVSLKSLNMTGFDTTNVTLMSWMFDGCSSLASLDVSSFDTTNITEIKGMFKSCTNLEHIYVGNGWSTDSVTDSSDMFADDGLLHNYNSSYTDKTKAIIDDGKNGGYLELEITKLIYWGLQSNSDETYELHLSSKPFTEAMSCSGTTDGIFSYTNQPWDSYKTAITKVSIDNWIVPRKTAFWFYGLKNVTSIEGLNNLYTSNATNMSYMFAGCSLLTSLDVSNFYTANVTDMSLMFYDCSSLTALDVSNFDTSNVTDMSWMFACCSSLTALDVSSFNTANVTDMSLMFDGCTSLTSLDVSNFDTSNVTDMSWMFEECSSLTSLDLSRFDTSNVTDMSEMFFECSNLSSLNVSGFDTSNVTDMRQMFYHCPNLISLDLSGFDTTKVTDMSSMFSGCSSLVSLNVSGFDTKNVTKISGMFRDCSSLTSLDISSFNTANVTSMNSMFADCLNLEHIYVGKDWNTDPVANSSDMFTDCGLLHNYSSSYTDKTKAIIDNGTNGGYLELKITLSFYWGLESLGAKTYKLHLSSAPFTQTMAYSGTTDGIFTSKSQPWNSYKSKITAVSIDNSIAPQQTAYWFYGLSNMTSIEGLNRLNTSNVTDMSRMFSNCSLLKSLDLSHFDTSNVTAMTNMFNGCAVLKTIKVSDDFVTVNVTSSNGMFTDCAKLVGGNGTKYNKKYTNGTYARYDDPDSSLPGYFTQYNKLNYNFNSITFPTGTRTCKDIEEGSTIGTLPVTSTTKKGYTLSWNTKKDGTGTQVNENTLMPDEETTIYAIWSINTYTIHLNSNGGTLASKQSYDSRFTQLNENEYEADYTVTSKTFSLPTLTKTYYKFNGWYDSSTSKKVTSIEKGSCRDYDLTASFTPITYTITYSTNSGTIAKSSTYDKSYTIETTSFTFPDSISRTGYTFDGWYMDKSFTVPASSLTSDYAKNVTLYAKWTPITYTIQYVSDNYSSNVIEISYDQSYKLSDIALPNPGKKAQKYTYTVNGKSKTVTATSTIKNLVSTNGQPTIIFRVTKDSKKNTELWSTATYTITYNLNGGTQNSKNKKSYTMGKEVTLYEPTRKGYAFAGWTDENMMACDSISSSDFGNRTFTANWSNYIYYITLDVNGGTLPQEYESNTLSYTVEDTITLLNPTRANYTFAGWYNGKTKVTAIKKGTTGNITLTAKWTEGTNYTIIYNKNSDSATGRMSNTKVTAGKNVTLTALAYKLSNKVFVEWNTEPGGTGISFKNKDTILKSNPLSSEGGESITLYAVWDDVKSFTIQFNSNDGTETIKNQSMSNKSYKALTANTYTRAGYTFTGWNTAADGSGTSYKNKETYYAYKGVNGGNVTLYAQWSLNTYSISYKNMKSTDTNPNPVSYTIEDGIMTLEDPSRTGYTFMGWYSDSEFRKPVDEIDVLKCKNFTFYAKFKKQK